MVAAARSAGNARPARRLAYRGSPGFAGEAAEFDIHGSLECNVSTMRAAVLGRVAKWRERVQADLRWALTGWRRGVALGMGSVGAVALRRWSRPRPPRGPDVESPRLRRGFASQRPGRVCCPAQPIDNAQVVA